MAKPSGVRLRLRAGGGALSVVLCPSTVPPPLISPRVSTPCKDRNARGAEAQLGYIRLSHSKISVDQTKQTRRDYSRPNSLVISIMIAEPVQLNMQKRVKFRDRPARPKYNKRARCVETRFANLLSHAPRPQAARLRRRPGTRLRHRSLPVHPPSRVQPALAVAANLQKGPLTSLPPLRAEERRPKGSHRTKRGEPKFETRVNPLWPHGGAAPPSSEHTQPRSEVGSFFQSQAAQFSGPILVSLSAPRTGPAPPQTWGAEIAILSRRRL